MALFDKILDPIFGGDTRREDRKRQQAIDEILSSARGIELPELQDITPEDYALIGDLNLPGRLEAVDVQGPDDIYVQDLTTAPIDSRFEDIAVDPRLKEQQIAALAGLEEIAQGGGMTLADEAALARIQSQAAAADRGRREAILQSSRQRGTSGSGMELLAQLQSAQGATDLASQQGLDVAGMAQKRALDALMQGGQLAGDIRGQEFGEQAQRAQALDAIQRFNQQNLMDTGRFNIANQMAAQQFNVQSQQAAREAQAAREMAARQFGAEAQNQAAQQTWQTAQQQANLASQAREQAQRTNVLDTPMARYEAQVGKQGIVSDALGTQSGYYKEIAARKKKEAAENQAAAIKAGTAIAGAF